MQLELIELAPAEELEDDVGEARVRLDDPDADRLERPVLRLRIVGDVTEREQLDRDEALVARAARRRARAPRPAARAARDRRRRRARVRLRCDRSDARPRPRRRRLRRMRRPDELVPALLRPTLVHAVRIDAERGHRQRELDLAVERRPRVQRAGRSDGGRSVGASCRGSRRSRGDGAEGELVDRRVESAGVRRAIAIRSDFGADVATAASEH